MGSFFMRTCPKLIYLDKGGINPLLIKTSIRCPSIVCNMRWQWSQMITVSWLSLPFQNFLGYMWCFCNCLVEPQKIHLASEWVMCMCSFTCFLFSFLDILFTSLLVVLSFNFIPQIPSSDFSHLTLPVVLGLLIWVCQS